MMSIEIIFVELSLVPSLMQKYQYYKVEEVPFNLETEIKGKKFLKYVLLTR